LRNRASFLTNWLLSKAKPKQTQIAFDTKLKTALGCFAYNLHFDHINRPHKLGRIGFDNFGGQKLKLG